MNAMPMIEACFEGQRSDRSSVITYFSGMAVVMVTAGDELPLWSVETVGVTPEGNEYTMRNLHLVSMK